MPNRALGNSRESRVADSLDTLGYHVIALRGSGARGASMRRRKHQCAGDLLAIPANREASLPWLQVECGGGGKRIAKAFDELTAAILPGFHPLVICFQKRRGAKVASRYFYTSTSDCFEKLSEAIAALAPPPRYAAWAGPA